MFFVLRFTGNFSFSMSMSSLYFSSFWIVDRILARDRLPGWKIDAVSAVKRETLALFGEPLFYLFIFQTSDGLLTK